MDAPFMPPVEDRPYLRRLAYTIVVAALLVVVWRAADLLMLGFGSVLGAVMFRSAARLMERIGVRNRRIALGLGTLFVLTIFGAIVYLLTVQFGTEIAGMLSNLPGTIAAIERGLGATEVGKAIVQAVQAATGGGTIANRLGTLLSGAGEVLVNLVIVIVGAMFFAADPTPYRNAALLLTPPPARPAVERAIGQISLALQLWLKAKVIDMVAMTLIIGGSLWLAGLKSWAALGLLGGLSEFIPYVGPAVAMLPSIGIAATVGGPVLWHTIVAYLFVRVAEGWLLTPFINRQVVNIPPALTLFTILGAGAVFGIYGLFFAGAMLVVGFVAVRELYLRDTLGEDIEGVPRKAEKLET
jgi:predicted PurR-regulated permease PerM